MLSSTLSTTELAAPMSIPPQLPGDGFNYKGTLIRSFSDKKLISVSDLWKAEGKPWKLRPDLWVKQEENVQLLEAVHHQTGSVPWLAIKGGSMQGTFAVPEVAARYASQLSLECGDWLCSALDVGANVTKAKRRTIRLGDIPLEVFQLPSGEYRLSQTQVAEAIEKDESSFREFLASKLPEALPYKGFKSGKLPVEGSRKPINPIPVDLAIAYWSKEGQAKNPIAVRLLAASAKEAIERRADRAFGVYRSEEEYNRRFSAFELLEQCFPEYVEVRKNSLVTDSMVLAEKQLFRKLRRKFPNEVLHLRKKDFIDQFVRLGAEADWHLTPEKGLPYPDGAAYRNAYPDLISQPTECYVNGKLKRVVLLFQYVDSIVDENDIKDCVYIREYIDLVEQHYMADHALLFFVSPYGVTRYGAASIKEHDDLRSCVGVITVRQLAKFLYSKAAPNKRDNIRAGRLKKAFQHLMEYKTLEELVNQEELKKLSIQSQSMPGVQLDLDLFAS